VSAFDTQSFVSIYNHKCHPLTPLKRKCSRILINRKSVAALEERRAENSPSYDG
jgi:hypothetical protein